MAGSGLSDDAHLESKTQLWFRSDRSQAMGNRVHSTWWPESDELCSALGAPQAGLFRGGAMYLTVIGYLGR